jgi:hypothetical protein
MMANILRIVWTLPAAAAVGLFACGSDPPTSYDPGQCTKTGHIRVDAHTPESVVADWGQPERLGSPVNTPCPEDAIEISGDGRTLYFLFTHDIVPVYTTPEDIFAQGNGTYRAPRLGGPSEFGEPVFYDLGKGIEGSLDGELSFSPDGARVYFHSLRATNTGYLQDPPMDDFLDIYAAEIGAGVPGSATNLGRPVNSEYPDGEHAIHPDGASLYFASSRPGGSGKNDIWSSSWNGASWTEPQNAGEPLNSGEDDLQPAFTADGSTMYFTSDRDPTVGIAIYRSSGSGGTWSEPELVMKGIAGEPSLTADGDYLYFVHVLIDSSSIVFDADVWLSERIP